MFEPAKHSLKKIDPKPNMVLSVVLLVAYLDWFKLSNVILKVNITLFCYLFPCPYMTRLNMF
jgi:hypothetical protein